MFVVRTYNGRETLAPTWEAAQEQARNLLSLLGITERAWVEGRRGVRLIETTRLGAFTHRWVEVVAA
jgi:hypothetical protein